MRTGTKDCQVKAFPGSCQSNTISKVGNGRTDLCLVGISNNVIIILVFEHWVTRLRINTRALITAHVPNGMSFFKIIHSADTCTCCTGNTLQCFMKISYFILQSSDVSFYTITEIFDMITP